MSFSLGLTATATEHFRTKKLGVLGDAVQQLNLGGTKIAKFQVQSKETNDDFAITDTDVDVDRLVIDKTTGNLDTNGGDMTVNTLNYTTLNPPVGGGGGVNNPMTVDLDCADFDTFNIFRCQARAFQKRPFVDSAPPTKDDSIYQEKIITGAYNRQPVVGTQEDFSPVPTGFPTGTPCQMADNLYSQAYNGVFARRTGLVLTPGLAGNYLNLGGQSAFQDRVTYDPLNLRYDPAVANAWTAVKFDTNLGTICPGPVGTQCNFITTISIHMEGDFLGANPNNILKIYARQYRGGIGAVLRDYQISHIQTGGTRVVRSDNKYLMSFSAGLNEDIQNGDYMEVFLENDAGSANDFNVGLFKVLIEVRPCP